MTEQKTKAAAEPPLDCRVGRDIVELLRDYVNITDDIALRLAAATEIERLRDLIECAATQADRACDGWNDALMHEGARKAGDAVRRLLVPNVQYTPVQVYIYTVKRCINQLYFSYLIDL